MSGVEWPEPGAVVIRDVFPAVVTAGPLTFRSALAVITRQRVYVWTGRGAPALNLAYVPGASEVPRLSAPRSTPAHLMLADGTTVTVQGQRGCGCGNPLKGWQPWRPYRKGVT